MTPDELLSMASELIYLAAEQVEAGEVLNNPQTLGGIQSMVLQIKQIDLANIHKQTPKVEVITLASRYEA